MPTDRDRARARAFYYTNRDRILAERKRRYREDPDYRADKNARTKAAKAKNPERYRLYGRNHALKKLCGITVEDVRQQLDKQGGVCAVCSRTEPGGAGDWHADHDHTSGRFRGVLCARCNMALGLFGDSAEALRGAVKYLEASCSTS